MLYSSIKFKTAIVPFFTTNDREGWKEILQPEERGGGDWLQEEQWQNAKVINVITKYS